MAQEPKITINQDESKVPAYTLPDHLQCLDGTKVVRPEEWEAKRRPELLKLFETHVYGKMPSPGKHPNQRFLVRSVRPDAVGGKATRKEIRVYFNGSEDSPWMDLLVYLPNEAARPAPVFLGLNFDGNHALETDPAITLSPGWFRNKPEFGYEGNRATEKSRGSDASSWPLSLVIDRGYALATAYYGDIDPDFDDGFQNGVHPLFDPPSQTGRAPDAWGSIAAWAWGLSRALDVLESEPRVDAARVVLHGHSRLGKTALWAGATDPRFAVVISIQSGEGGAALSRRRFGETVHRINESFPHWFCGNFKKFNEREPDLPVDQHELIALLAPRPVLVCSASEDLWADPKGEFLSAAGADPVYALFGLKGIGTDVPPKAEQLTGGVIGYHLRPGKHEVTELDWRVFLEFADRHLPSAK
jgi:hypothetical protein